MPSALDIFMGPGEMRARCREMDWAATPLGPVEGWSPPLRTAAQVVLASGLPNAILWGRDLIQIYNDSYAELIRAKHPAALGRGYLESWPEVAHINAPIYERVFGGETVRLEHAHSPLARRGVVEDVYPRVALSPIRDETGAVAGVLANILETTSQVMLERFRAVHEASPDGIQLCDSVRDHAGRVTDFVYRYVNAGGLRLVGRAAEDLVGRRMLEVFPGLAGDELFAAYVRVAETGEPLQREVVYARDGLNGAFRVTGVRVGDGLALAFSDVSDRVRALAAEREARASRDALLDSMTDAFAAFDDGWRYTYLNRQAEVVLGHRREALLGRVVWEVFPEAREGIAWESAITAKREQRVVEYEFYLAPVGKWILARNHPIPGGVAALFRDVTADHERLAERERLLAAERSAREEAETLARELETSNNELLRLAAEAEAANRAKSEFLAVMSHELRTPLNAIGGYAELLGMGIRGPVTETQREDLERIQRSQRHLLSLINEVLNYAKLETGSVRYEVADVSVAAALAAAEALILPQVRARGLALETTAGDPGLLVRADREKVQQILVNLLSNAVKFTDRGGRIAVVCGACTDAVRGEMVAITVRDTGVGIPADKLEAIFEPFVQVGRALNSPSEGTGLGLAISRDLARGMRGDLAVESVEGAGSTFTLTLPRAV